MNNCVNYISDEDTIYTSEDTEFDLKEDDRINVFHIVDSFVSRYGNSIADEDADYCFKGTELELLETDSMK